MDSASQLDPAAPGSSRSRRRAAFAGTLGTLVENYDFAVYTYVVVFTAPLFFPGGNTVTAVIQSLAVYAVGFAARPFGGFFFGRLGDRYGRRSTLISTVLLMGGATFFLGVIPTYESIGLWAPILVVVARLAQGFSAGGEVMGSATYVIESSTPGRRGRFSVATPLGSILGAAMGPAVVGVCIAVVGIDSMATWGWRIPFLISLPLTIAVLLLRLRIEESPEFVKLERNDEIATSPVAEAARRHWRAIIICVLLTISINLFSYTLTAYMPIYFVNTIGVPGGTASWMAAIAIAASAPAMFIGGYATDRFGGKTTLTAALAAAAIIVYPAMIVMSGVGNSVWMVGGVYWLLLVALGVAVPPVYHALMGLFPTRVRYSGAALGFNVGNAIGGGCAPLIAASLMAWTGDPRSPGYVVAFAAVLGITTIIAAGSRTTRNYEELAGSDKAAAPVPSVPENA